MQKDERDKLRREIEDRLLPFLLVRGRKGSSLGVGRKLQRDGWLRCIRQATGMPVDEFARRLGVCRWEIHRLEESERNARIMLDTLSRAAKGLGCKLVYALVPVEGTLKDMASEHEEARQEKLRLRHRQRDRERNSWLKAIGWRESMLGALRTYLRREGIRVRPRKTEQGVDEQLNEFKKKMELARMANRAAVLMEGKADSETTD